MGCAPPAPGRAGAGLSALTDAIPPRALGRPPAPGWAEGSRIPPLQSPGSNPSYAVNMAGNASLPAPSWAGDSGSGLVAASAPDQPVRIQRHSCTCTVAALGQGDPSVSVAGSPPLDLSVGRDGPNIHGPVAPHGAGRSSLQSPGVAWDTASPVDRPSVMPPRISFPPTQVWILGDSFVFWAARRAEIRNYGRNLGLSSTVARIRWLGLRGLRWHQGALMRKIRMPMWIFI